MSERSRKCKLLINGYTRKIEKRLSQILPQSIITTCFDFYYISNPCIESYVWKITDPNIMQQIKAATVGTKFKSPVFTFYNLRWYLALYPNGQDMNERGDVKLFLYLAVLPPTIQSISLSRLYTFTQGNITHDYDDTIEYQDDHLCCLSWPNRILPLNDILKYNQLTFTVETNLYAIFGKENNDVTKNYIQNFDSQYNVATFDSFSSQIKILNENIEKLQHRMDEIELKMNEKEHSNDKLEEILNRIKLIEDNMSKISNNDSVREPKELKLWLENECKLPEYFDVFMENGIEDLQTVSLLTIETLKQIKIDKIGHQMKILHQAMKLKQSSNDM